MMLLQASPDSDGAASPRRRRLGAGQWELFIFLQSASGECIFLAKMQNMHMSLFCIPEIGFTFYFAYSTHVHTFDETYIP
jgi:hypothetical protein